MFNRPVVKLGVYGAAIVLAVALVSPALAGGFQIAIETPGSSNDPLLKEAVLVVRTFGCHVPTAAALSGTAEGLVNGQRKSVALEFKPTSEGVYAIRQQWAGEGAWVLAITARYSGITSSALVELGPNGNVRLIERSAGGKQVPTRIVQRKLSTSEIDTALKTLAGGGTVIGLAMDPADSSSSSAEGRIVAALAAMFFVAGSVVLTRKLRARS
ncbi:MAG TPA: hypothetical protein VJH03_12160 [Blastocatellia bacterium]|nr:hypothetical protein [Blastocatellia bacterium]